jgi:hypothetical protein
MQGPADYGIPLKSWMSIKSLNSPETHKSGPTGLDLAYGPTGPILPSRERKTQWKRADTHCVP